MKSTGVVTVASGYQFSGSTVGIRFWLEGTFQEMYSTDGSEE